MVQFLFVVLLLVLLERNTKSKEGGMGCVSVSFVAVMVLLCAIECSSHSKEPGFYESSRRREIQSLGTIIDIRISSSKMRGLNQSEFSAGTPEIVVNAKLLGAQSGATVDSFWYITESSVLPSGTLLCNSKTFAVIGNERVWFSARRPPANWAAGKYRVELFINSRLDSTASFSVVQ